MLNKMFVCRVFALFCFSAMAVAQTSSVQHSTKQPNSTSQTNPVQERVQNENKAEKNNYAIVFYKPTYILPYYYTGSPYNSIYKNNTPGNESLDSDEIKYQLSFKVPVWKNIFNTSNSIYLAYTQLSYWQAYNHRAFFRETDYEPEVYLSHPLNYHLGKDWRINFLSVGAVHQSNGQGGSLERSWNRAYLGIIASSDHWVIGFRPWVIFHDTTYERQNPNLSTYLGYEEILVVYKYGNQVFSFSTRNFIESGGRRSGNILSWSFPLTQSIKGYVQAFSGYGQSLIEYNHRTNSIGVGIALSNWV